MGWHAPNRPQLNARAGSVFWSGSLSPASQVLLKSRRSFSRADSGSRLSETNNCGRIEVPRLITSVGALPLSTGSIAVSTGATKGLSRTFEADHRRTRWKVFRQSPFLFHVKSVPSTTISLCEYARKSLTYVSSAIEVFHKLGSFLSSICSVFLKEVFLLN